MPRHTHNLVAAPARNKPTKTRQRSPRPVIHPVPLSLRPSPFCLLPSGFCLLPSAFCLLASGFCLLASGFCLLASGFCLIHQTNPPIANAGGEPSPLLPSGVWLLPYSPNEPTATRPGWPPDPRPSAFRLLASAVCLLASGVWLNYKTNPPPPNTRNSRPRKALQPRPPLRHIPRREYDTPIHPGDPVPETPSRPALCLSVPLSLCPFVPSFPQIPLASATSSVYVRYGANRQFQHRGIGQWRVAGWKRQRQKRQVRRPQHRQRSGQQRQAGQWRRRK
jgi:hypothetical protein